MRDKAADWTKDGEINLLYKAAINHPLSSSVTTVQAVGTFDPMQCAVKHILLRG